MSENRWKKNELKSYFIHRIINLLRSCPRLSNHIVYFRNRHKCVRRNRFSTCLRKNFNSYFVIEIKLENIRWKCQLRFARFVRLKVSWNALIVPMYFIAPLLIRKLTGRLTRGHVIQFRWVFIIQKVISDIFLSKPPMCIYLREVQNVRARTTLQTNVRDLKKLPLSKVNRKEVCVGWFEYIVGVSTCTLWDIQKNINCSFRRKITWIIAATRRLQFIHQRISLQNYNWIFEGVVVFQLMLITSMLIFEASTTKC